MGACADLLWQQRRLGLRFGGFFGIKPRVGSRKYRTKRANALHGQIVKYVTERRDDGEDVVGRGGNISIRDGVLLLFTSGEVLFRADIETLEIAELLSGDGVILTAPNIEEDGRVRSLVVHFVYYRK